MATSKFSSVCLMIAVLVLGGPAFAESPSEADVKATERDAQRLADAWKQSTHDWLTKPDNVADEPKKKAQVTLLVDRLVKDLRGKKCRDDAQVKTGIQDYIERKIHELRLAEPGAEFQVHVWCTKGSLVPSMWIANFNVKRPPAPSTAAATLPASSTAVATLPASSAVLTVCNNKETCERWCKAHQNEDACKPKRPIYCSQYDGDCWEREWRERDKDSSQAKWLDGWRKYIDARPKSGSCKAQEDECEIKEAVKCKDVAECNKYCEQGYDRCRGEEYSRTHTYVYDPDGDFVRKVQEVNKKYNEDMRAIDCHGPVVACIVKCKSAGGKQDACGKTCTSGGDKKAYDECLRRAYAS